MLLPILLFHIFLYLFDIVGDFCQYGFRFVDFELVEGFMVPNIAMLFPLMDAFPVVVQDEKIFLEFFKLREIMLQEIQMYFFIPNILNFCFEELILRLKMHKFDVILLIF
jgi:hypothetical protein